MKFKCEKCHAEVNTLTQIEGKKYCGACATEVLKARRPQLEEPPTTAVTTTTGVTTTTTTKPITKIKARRKKAPKEIH